MNAEDVIDRIIWGIVCLYAWKKATQPIFTPLASEEELIDAA